eukprot:4150766-Lingulodinium_polyedra.AAC.1
MAEAGRVALAMVSAAATFEDSILWPRVGATLAVDLAVRVESLPRALHGLSGGKRCVFNAT